jgi:single-strand DNA-binding protein
MNQVIIEGNLTREPELKPAGDKTVINFGIAYNTRKKDASGQWVECSPMFFDVEYWPNDPQYWAKRLTKGTSAVVSGSLKYETWQKDGQNFSRVKIRAQEIFAKWLPEIGNTSQNTAPAAQTPPPPTSGNNGFPEDMPF